MTREEAIRILKLSIENSRNHVRFCFDNKGITALDMAIQALEQEPKTGHWIIMGDRYIKCSECGHITKTESPDIYNFCMVCGANMSENPTGSKPEISSYYGLKSYVRERSEE